MYFQLLNRQHGVVAFEALKPHFLSVYRASHAYLSPNASLPSLQLHVRRHVEESSATRVLPVTVHSISSVKNDLREAYRAIPANRLSDAETAFRAILEALLFVVVTTDEEAKEVRH